MTAEPRVIRFSESTGAAPAWAASVCAMRQAADDTVESTHAVVLIAAQTEYEAQSKALNIALRTWSMSEGWSHHDAVVIHLENSLEKWNQHDSTRRVH